MGDGRLKLGESQRHYVKVGDPDSFTRSLCQALAGPARDHGTMRCFHLQVRTGSGWEGRRAEDEKKQRGFSVQEIAFCLLDSWISAQGHRVERSHLIGGDQGGHR